MVSGIYCKTFLRLAYLISAEGEEHSEITHITRHRVDHLIRLMLVGMLCVGVIDNLLFFYYTSMGSHSIKLIKTNSTNF